MRQPISKINFTNALNLLVIAGYSFNYCTNLQSIEFPPNLQRILSYAAFQYCTQLTTIIFPDNCSLIEIAAGAFRHTKIASLRISAHCEKLCGEAFGFTYIQNITIEPGNAKYQVLNNSIYSYNFEELIFYSPIATSFNVHPNTTTICNVCFEGNDHSFVIPNQITKFETSAFYNYYAKFLWILHPPSEITKYTFGYCIHLEGIYFFGTINSIEGKAFYESKKLRNVFFFLPVHSINDTAFYEPSSICFTGDVESVKKCLPSISIHECKLTSLNSRTHAKCFHYKTLSFLFVCLINNLS